jgi:hypothetical protein
VDRGEHYGLKLIGSRVAAVMGLFKPGMSFGIKQALSREFSVRSRLIGILAGGTVVGADYGKYMAFAMAGRRIAAQFSGASAIDEIALLEATWLARGLDAGVLGQVRAGIIGVPPTGV